MPSTVPLVRGPPLEVANRAYASGGVKLAGLLREKTIALVIILAAARAF
jgi:hypothetical protein